jgi:hypothetical protein
VIAAALFAAATSPFGLLATPPVLHTADGRTAEIRVFDVGARSLEVSVSIEPVAKVNGKCTASGQGAVGVTLASPAQVHLDPGQYATATVRIAQSAPSQDLAVVFSAAAGVQQGNVRVNGAVGSQLVVNGPHAASAACVSQPTPSSASSTSSAPSAVTGSVTAAPRSGWPWPWIVTAVAVGALLSAVVSQLLRRRRT